MNGKHDKAMKAQMPPHHGYQSPFDPFYPGSDQDEFMRRKRELIRQISQQGHWQDHEAVPAVPAVPARNTSPSSLDLVEFYNEIEPLRKLVDAIRSCYETATPTLASFATASVKVTLRSHHFPEWAATTDFRLTREGLTNADHRTSDDSLVVRFFPDTVRMAGVPDIVKRMNGVIIVSSKVVDAVDSLTVSDRAKMVARTDVISSAFAQNHPEYGPFLADWRRGEFDRCKHRFHAAMQEFKDVDSDTLDALVRDWIVTTVHDS